MLSHGQALVESGFAFNKQLLDDKFRYETVAAQGTGQDLMISRSIKPHQVERTN